MRKSRLYIDQPLEKDDVVILSAEKSHYLSHVLRMRKNAGLTLINNSGFEFDAKILELDKKNTRLQVCGVIEQSVESSLHITLVLCISRSQHMDYSIQKAVELGVHTIVPVFSEFSNVKLDSNRIQNKLSHWRNIIISATEQCGRSILANLNAPIAFEKWLEQDHKIKKLILHPGTETAMSSIAFQEKSLILMLGPEGGFSDNEITLARQYDCVPVHLGPRVLRAETAVVASLSVAQHCWGDLK